MAHQLKTQILGGLLLAGLAGGALVFASIQTAEDTAAREGAIRQAHAAAIAAQARDYRRVAQARERESREASAAAEAAQREAFLRTPQGPELERVRLEDLAAVAAR